MKSIPFVIVENYYWFVKRQMKSLPSGHQNGLLPPRSVLKPAQNSALSARQSFLGHAPEHNVLEVMLCAERVFFWLVPILVYRVDIGLKTLNLWLSVHPPTPGGDQRLPNKADGLHHIPSFFLAEQRVALSLQQADILIVAHDHEQIAQLGDFLEKANMTGVQPIKTARDGNFFPGRVNRQDLRLKCRKTLEVQFMNYMVTQAMSFAEGPFQQVVAGFVNHPGLCLAEEMIWEGVLADQLHLWGDHIHVADRLDGVQPFDQGELWGCTFQCLDNVICPYQRLDFTKPGGFMQKANVPGAQIVKTAGYDDVRHRSFTES